MIECAHTVADSVCPLCLTERVRELEAMFPPERLEYVSQLKAERDALRQAIADDLSDAKHNCGKYEGNYSRCEGYLIRDRQCPDCPVDFLHHSAKALERGEGDG